jgi:hypothetical protein
MKLFSDFRSEHSITVNGVTYTTETETLAKAGKKKSPTMYAWTIYGPSGYMVTRVVTTSLRFSVVEPELRVRLENVQAQAKS